MAIKVALAGSTGKIGPTMLRELLDAQFEVVILTRRGSRSTDALPKRDNQTIVEVDYANTLDLTSALRGVEAVVPTLSSSALDTQKVLVDASVAAGVKRFIPSEFATDLSNSLNLALPSYPGKIESQAYLEQTAAANPDFTYTLVYNNVWWDWGVHAGFIVNYMEHKATLWDGGDVPFSTTRLATVGKAVVAVIKNQKATKNRPVYVHDAVITINEMIKIFKSIDGVEWTTEVQSTADAEKKAREEFKTPGVYKYKVGLNFLYRAAFSQEHRPDFTDKLDKELLGLLVLQGEEIAEAVSGFL